MFNNTVFSPTVLVILLIATIQLNAQQKSIDHNFNSWFTNISNYSFNTNWSLGNELHVRRTNGLKQWQQFLVRPFIDYKRNDNVVFTVGYTFIQSWPYGKQPIQIKTPEHNIWEQVTLNHSSGSVKFSHRFRYEQRFIGTVITNATNEIMIDGNNFSQRLRYRFTGIVPIAKSENWFLSWFDEVWINLDNNLMPLSLNQNWLYGGLGYKFGERGNFQLGYMQQFISKGDGIRFENNPTLQVLFVYNFGKQKALNE